MSRLILAAALGALALVPMSAHADVPVPGGKCDGVVDVMCRSFQCGPDDLDCGMIPPCIVWVAGKGCVVG